MSGEEELDMGGGGGEMAHSNGSIFLDNLGHH